MNAQELADIINGREVGSETDKEIVDQAAANGLVIVYGYSDDNIELDGAIREEIGAYDGTTILVTSEGKIRRPWESIDCTDEDEAEAYFKAKALSFKTIQCDWAPVDDADVSWRITTDMPHAKFDIMEDGDVFCRGIVFSMKDLAP